MNEIKYTDEQKKEISLLRANYEMLQKTKEEIKLRGNSDNLRRVELAQQDVVEQISKIDVNYANDLVRTFTESTDDFVVDYDDIIYNDPIIVNNNIKAEKVENLIVKDDILVQHESKNEFNNDNFEFGQINTDTQYDIISLPSNGQCYKNKVSRIPVSYLTAYDENLITSPNLYKDGLIIDFLLKQKVVGNHLNLDELCVGDVDAIVLFLRATSYGTEFPIIAKDPITGEDVESVVDLSKLEYKPFSLVGDENGHFEFVLPVSKDVVKFKFLTRKDLRILETLEKVEYNGIKARQIKNDVKSLVDMIKKDNLLSGRDKQELINDLNKMNPWIEKLEKNSPLPYSKTITNRLELSIMSINGNSDRQYISKYIKNMIAKDSLMLRRYILENEPGVNFEIEVVRPESLGGGSFKTFLEWDDSVFLNIT